MFQSELTWLETLPILRGIRSVYKFDINTSPADMVYGEPLRLHGEFLSQAITENQDAPELVKRLFHQMTTLCPITASRHNSKATFIFKDSADCSSNIFLRGDTVCGYSHPLTPLHSILLWPT